jgi:hypothetical protein
MTVRRSVRTAIRLVLVTAAVGGMVKVARSILARSSAAAGAGPIRTGSFDAWPSVPAAPGRSRPEG